jgi:hypothetical protein
MWHDWDVDGWYTLVKEDLFLSKIHKESFSIWNQTH